MQVVLALPDNMGRLITSKWLQKNGVSTTEASDWNGLTQTLRELFQARTSSAPNCFDAQFYRSNERTLKAKLLNIQEMKNPIFVIVVDIGLLDLTTDIWKEQLNLLHKYFGKAKFAWVINHDTPNTLKMELRRKGHILMINKPLYKAKMIHILEAVMKERRKNIAAKEEGGDVCEFLETDSSHFDAASSDSSDTSSEMASSKSNPIDKERECVAKSHHPSSKNQIKNYLVGLTDECLEDSNNSRNEEAIEDSEPKVEFTNKEESLLSKESQGKEDSECGETQKACSSSNVVNGKKSLEGLRILLAEDTPVLQRVATIMLEKMGATVAAVCDGQQAVNALNCGFSTDDCRRDQSLMKDKSTKSQAEILSQPPYDLILMDCQVRIMKEYTNAS